MREAPEDPSASFAALPSSIRAKAREKTLLVLTKANARSTVHRPTHLDYIGIKRYDAHGEVVGEHRFIGLYASGAYTGSPFAVPVLRRKVSAVIERAGFLPASHDHKDLVQTLETYPRDDLFQIDVDHLYDIAMGILRLQERRRVRLFVHREPYGRFVSCLVFIPRDRYTTQVRERIAHFLVDAYGSKGYEWNTRLSDSVLARLHYVLHLENAGRRHGRRRGVGEARRRGRAGLGRRPARRADRVAGRGDRPRRAARVGRRVPAAYRDDFDATEALADFPLLEPLGAARPLAARLTIGADHLDLKLYGVGEQPSLSEVLPRLSNMGVVVDDEHPYELTPRGLETRWMKWFRLRAPGGTMIDPAALRLFEEAFLAVVDGRAEDDAFNRLVLTAGLAWREVALLRAYGRYLRQTGTRFSQTYIAGALSGHTEIARRLVELFVARLDPWVAGSNAGANASGDGDACDRLADEIRAELDAVTSLDEDRILRALLHLVLATLRTNWFQDADAAGNPLPCVALKLDPSAIPDLPLPRPLYEIFVYSPRVEGVHLRAGKVARGGIRWSDRREDFRTEVLGLMKAQRVKNAVIVPAGAKGGFVVKRPPADPAQLRDEVEACYRLFIGSLLDITDNLVDGKVVPPNQVVRYDDDDPYLVVAADKGTAAFSDVANEIALERGFWLGDAFASGGEHGYDHKAMGITARGAWESVRRHFRHLGLDPDRDDFTVAGIGDMSGDVFGNAMLLSEHIQLVAAFDHRHVFLDPDPDAAESFGERQAAVRAAPLVVGRLRHRVALAGRRRVRAHAEVDPALARGAHRASASTTASRRSRPAELIRAILRAPVDLLYNGGIGTYVKAATETHAAVGDKANDTVRVDGRELRCRSVAEGGNLGFTQDGRVEYALTGGRINTDAIDNSAGVDTSDHEVNIKIVVDGAVRGRRAERSRSQHVARQHDRRGRGARAARQLPPEPRPRQRARAGDRDGRRARALHARAGDHRAPQPRRRAAAHRRTARRPAQRRARAHRARAGRAARVREDRAGGGAARVRPPRRPRLHPRARALVPLRRARALPRTHPQAHAAPGDHRDRARERSGEPRRNHVRVPDRRGDRRARARHRARARDRACGVRPGRAVARHRGARRRRVGVDVQTEMYLASRRLVERGARWFLRNRPQPLPVAATVAFFAVPVTRLDRDGRRVAPARAHRRQVRGAGRSPRARATHRRARTSAARARHRRARRTRTTSRSKSSPRCTTRSASSSASSGSATGSSTSRAPTAGTRSPATHSAKTRPRSTGASSTRPSTRVPTRRGPHPAPR